jgi:hypothetical protein
MMHIQREQGPFENYIVHLLLAMFEKGNNEDVLG